MKIKAFFTVLIILVGIMNQTTAQEIKDAQIRLQASSRTLNIGDQVKLDIDLSYENLKPGSRIYVHLMPLRGKKWVTSDNGLFSGSDISLNMTGGVQDGDRGYFNFTSYNYPVTKWIKKDMLEAIFTGWGIPQESLTKTVEAVATSEKGYDLSLAFLTSNGQRTSGIERVPLGFTVPDYAHCYNGILLVPVILNYDNENQATLAINSANFIGTTLEVKPYQPCPAEKPRKSTPKEEDIPGSVQISAVYPSNAVLYTGSSNTLEVEIAYTNLQANSVIYMAFLPSTERNKFLFGKYLLTLPGISGLVFPTFFNASSDLFRIPLRSEPIKVPFVSDQILEAALVGAATRGGSGKVTGKVTFTPPPYSTRYRRVYLMPLILVETDAGAMILMDMDRLQGSYVSVSEN